jgi:NADH-dependent peroxiredoxin subunit F
MLDQAFLTQLSQAFSSLTAKITLVLSASDHAQQDEVRTTLTSLVSTSAQLQLVESEQRTTVPRISLLRDGLPLGVSFRGMPGGHEFTSFVLAILNADGKGRMPDTGLTARIRAIRGPLRLRTYISLECTNCPDVVQALNLVALIHDDCQHEMCDGGVLSQEVERLRIQGVPAVFSGDDLVHVGKSTLGELVDLLEQRFGTTANSSNNTVVHTVDVAVVGGGPAGAAAAIYSARKGLRVAVIAGRIGGQVSDTMGIENLISVPYTEGPKLVADLRSHLVAAGVQVLDQRTVESVIENEHKVLHLKGGEVVHAEQLIITTGAKWRELGVPGEREHIGHGVAFCPHCDGPFFKGRRVAVVGGGNSGVEAAIDLAGICTHVTLFEYGDELRADAVLQRKARSLANVTIITQARTSEVVGDGKSVSAIRYENRATKVIENVAVDGVFVQIGLSPNSALVKDLVETNRIGEIVVDARGRTSRPGIYAAGDVTTTPYKQIVIAMGEGAKTALTAFEDRLRAPSFSAA